MSLERMLEVGATSSLAFITAVGFMQEQLSVSGLLGYAIPAGVAALVGYFTARVTAEREMGELKTMVREGFLATNQRITDVGNEMRRYYQPRAYPLQSNGQE